MTDATNITAANYASKLTALRQITEQRECETLGTCWVAPGEGSTWQELAIAFDDETPFNRRFNRKADRYTPTNLKLTGAAIQPYDRERWRSENVR